MFKAARATIFVLGGWSYHCYLNDRVFTHSNFSRQSFHTFALFYKTDISHLFRGACALARRGAGRSG